MNFCANCNHEFELQPGLIQICPRCGQEMDSEATLEDLELESSSVGDETLELEDDPVIVSERDIPIVEIISEGQEQNSSSDHSAKEPIKAVAENDIPIVEIIPGDDHDGSEETMELDEEFQLADEDDEFADVQENIVTEEIDEELVASESEQDSPIEETFVSTQASEHDDNLLLPRIPVDPGQTMEDSNVPQDEMTEIATEVLDIEDDESDDTDFELAEEAKTEEATEFFDPEIKQPTIELQSKPVTASSLDYAEREIVGLSVEDEPNDDADYFISIQEKDSQLGSGASGVVYKATQKSLDRTVAIKLLKKQVKAGTQSQSRKTTPKQKDIEKFLYESQITAGLDHPNVITVHDLGVTSNNTLFYSMKLFEGGKDWSKDFDKNTLVENLDIFNDVCDAMRRAHRDRIIHRDLKPQNVLVGDFGEVQVTDWGLAIDLKSEKKNEFCGGGTPCYMAPEMSKHYLAQQELRTLRSKHEWTIENAPNNSDEIQVLKEKISQNEINERSYAAQIDELSDVYVLGAILFQIARGYPPHLFQIGAHHRRQWGSQTGKNKVRRELEMSAKGTLANYLVKNLPNPEAREALRDIAARAMAQLPSERYADVAELQQAVKDFRDFMRCIEDTQRGDREVESSKEDSKSYVNLNNAIYAYEGALENYPDYKPANDGLAKATFLFAERALTNQDFELGLSTMTEKAIERQPDQRLAFDLRSELTKQRDRRDRRKQLLFLATMASLVAIGLGVLFGLFAIFARSEANRLLAIAKKAKSDIVNSKQEEILSLNQLVEARNKTTDLKVSQQAEALTLAKIEQESTVATKFKDQIAAQSNLDKLINDQKSQQARIAAELANKDRQIADVEKIDAQIESERIKETTQFNQYINRLKSIEGTIDEAIAKSKLNEIFNCTDISLPVKNSWELHHLYKQANPNRRVLGNEFSGTFKLLEAAQNVDQIVALTNDNELYRFTASSPRPKPIQLNCLEGCNVLSMDLSSDGRWLIVARDFLDDQAATNEFSLPIIYDMTNDELISIDSSVMEKLRFNSPRQEEDSSICKEKYYCRPQHVEFLDSTGSSIQVFMVDQRAQLGLNQIRCSVLDLALVAGTFDGSVTKAKIGGQLFINSPGLLTATGCLASAYKTATGEIIAAVANSHPKFGLTVLSLDDSDQYLESSEYLNDSQGQEKYFARMKSRNELFDSIASEFAPTSLKITDSASGSCSLLVGNGKGEIVDLQFQRLHPSDRVFVLTRKTFIRTDLDSATNTNSRLVENGIYRFHVTQQSSGYSSIDNSQGEDRSTTTLPLHKSAVRKIEVCGKHVYSTSETEIVQLTKQGLQWTATRRFFGQSGNIASMAASQIKDKTELYTVSNVADGSTELLAWSPNSNNHTATIQLDDFRNNSLARKRIVAGSADMSLDSEAVVLAFDDGTLEYFHPTSGSLPIGRPSNQGRIDGVDDLSQDDFRNGRLKFFEESQQLIMYSNSVGLLAWDLNDPNQTDPEQLASASKLYSGTATNSTVAFSADATGQNIVTSHPNELDSFVLWQRRDDNSYVPNVVGPFASRDGASQANVNVSIRPTISPNGNTIAVAIRVRSAFEVVLIESSPTTNPRKFYTYKSDTRTNFRSIKFINNDTIFISEDRVQNGVERVTSLVTLKKTLADWEESSADLPKFVTDEYRQISIADASQFADDVKYVGFGIKEEDIADDEQDCNVELSNRELFAFDSNNVLFRKSIPFSRRIQPTFQGSNLIYLNAGQRSLPVTLEMVDLSKAKVGEPVAVIVDENIANRAKRWTLASTQHAAMIGKDWFYISKLDPNQAKRKFDFTLSNKAVQIQLAKNSILLHHENKSVSLVKIDRDKSRVGAVARMNGLQKFVSLSPDGKKVAFVSEQDNQTYIADQNLIAAADLNKRAKAIPTHAVALTWVTQSALKNLGMPGNVDFSLATLSRKNDDLLLQFWTTDGKQIDTNPELQRLKLTRQRNSKVRSFDISRATGELLTVLWGGESDDRADIWRFAVNQKPAQDQDLKGMPRSWFPIATGGLGSVYSVDIGEVVDEKIPTDKIAPRIVIGVESQGSKSIRLHAVELGLDFKPRPLLELTNADKLQQVDQIVGASFSGDGKTLLSMTSERARIRLSSGWNNPKTDVDFNEKIKVFNIRRENAQLEDLQKERDGLLAKQSTLNDASAEKSRLESELANAKAEVTAARVLLEQKETELRVGVEKIKKELRGKEQESIQKIEKQIAKKQSELTELKKELEQ